MSRPLVVLIDLCEPYFGAFAAWSRQSGFDCEPVAAATLGVAETGGAPSLAVMLVATDADANPERVRLVRKTLVGAPLVVIAGALRVDTVVALLRAGVCDVIGLPAPVSDVVARASLHATSIDDKVELTGLSAAALRLQREIAAAAPLRSTVLITGETGTGKGVAARRLHRLSAQRDLPFVHVDCSALAPSVIESELFGHERGAYTGAVAPRAGRFETAGSGTIFLDEIGDLELGPQAKLLRILQDREYERVGGSSTRIAAARVIAATNHDLRAAVAAGRFRADLFFRLNVFHIHVPALRERRSDVPALARAGAQRIAENLGMLVPQFSDAFYDDLCQRNWPGNVRELMNEIERALIRHQAGLDYSSQDETWEHDLRHEDVASERVVLEEALLAAGGNISRAARRIGVARSTLRFGGVEGIVGVLVAFGCGERGQRECGEDLHHETGRERERRRFG
ncbi:MAG: sigma-54 dependent transcriptional regulator [Proteobacteria bacterium]|nr:sigma-54 dependent transcriptional regulator [Pseudomonadota bacterium]